MKITLITVTYNSESTLAYSISSVNNQTYPNIEHIIIDGVSTDNTLEIAQSTPNRITKVISEPDQGIYDAMNKGIAIASGEIIGILNSDDFLASPNILQHIVQLFETTGCDAVYGNLDFVGSRNIDKVIRHWKSSPYINNSFQNGWHPPHPTFFVKKEIYIKYGLFDTSLEVSADFELMLRFIEKYKIKAYYLNETIVKMRYGGVSTTSLKGIIVGNRNVLKAFRKNGVKVSPIYTINRIVSKLKQFFKR